MLAIFVEYAYLIVREVLQKSNYMGSWFFTKSNYVGGWYI